MGAKTALLVHADGAVPELLRRAEGVAPDRERTDALMARLYPGWTVTPGNEPRELYDAAYPGHGEAFAGSWPGVEVLCDQRFMVDRPSELPAGLLATGPGRRTVLHAMHSVVDWLAFAVWEDGRLVRSLSLSPDSGVIEDLGERLPFELPYWAGGHPVKPLSRADDVDEVDEKPYPLPFHPLSLGEDALRALVGFVAEGATAPDDLDPEAIALLGYRLGDPDAARQAAAEAEAAAVRAAVARMSRPRSYRMGPDGKLVRTDLLP
ncbi:hypothetical protein GCM10009759_11410 [Kitasatospora saccharophila]|uniref:Uncharacterized protein n=1 Tax=Kitasatospora saccharophila TaxID=407973 RepID=A0ABN2WC34_9ACTN